MSKSLIRWFVPIALLVILGGVWICTSCAGLNPAAAAHKVAPRVGFTAPEIELQTPDQQPVRLSDLRGKVVLVNFWATWCGPCSAEMLEIEKAYQQYKAQGLEILAVNQAEWNDGVKGYADLYQLHFTILMDEKQTASQAYDVRALPTTFFVDRAGVIRDTAIGGPMTLASIEAKIKPLLEQAP